MGVFVGVSSSDSALERQASGARPEIYEATGASHAIVANRISYLLDLTGPSLAVDTACSSSLTAFHIALQSIRRGGVRCGSRRRSNHMSFGARLRGFLRMGRVLAPDGRPRAFSEGARDMYAARALPRSSCVGVKMPTHVVSECTRRSGEALSRTREEPTG